MKKVCSTCNQEKLITEFRKDLSRPSGVQHHCKECAREYHRSAYVKKYAGRYHARNTARRRKQAKWLRELKETLSCVVCSENDVACLEFHHLNPAEKDIMISGHTSGSWKRIEEEIMKCVCLCSNCHRKFHAGSFSLLPAWLVQN